MKNLSILIVLFVLNCHRLNAEIVTVVSPGGTSATNFVFQATGTAYTNTYSVVTNSSSNLVVSVSVRAGETAKVLHSNIGLLATFPNGVAFNLNPFTVPLPVFVGPGSIESDPAQGFLPQFFTVQITRNDEPFIPSGSVLVPADSSGPVSVILESSTNLVAWSSTLPGTYGTTSQNQYFRVRAVRQTP